MHRGHDKDLNQGGIDVVHKIDNINKESICNEKEYLLEGLR